jgi:hypothetical protein
MSSPLDWHKIKESLVHFEGSVGMDKYPGRVRAKLTQRAMENEAVL